jgi:hypothetical protein
MPCKYLGSKYGDCKKPGHEHVCGQWSKWWYEIHRDINDKITFCQDEQFKERWER